MEVSAITQSDLTKLNCLCGCDHDWWIVSVYVCFFSNEFIEELVIQIYDESDRRDPVSPEIDILNI